MTTQLTKAVQAAIRKAPCSVRALAVAAGVPQSSLSRILAGKLTASPELANAVMHALERWAKDCHHAADRIRTATAKTKGG